VAAFIEDEGYMPNSIMMQNHGFFALGDSPKAVKNITDMAEKCSQITAGAYALGGPRFMPKEDVERIFTRPDEKYREKSIGKE
jgi:ribulose-5-phosphate 4-epimerase/fuculose-1-phosphate aldolase